MILALQKELRSRMNSEGTAHKMPRPLDVLLAPLEYADERYVVWWYLLVATGARPANLWDARIRFQDGGIEVHFDGGTKSEEKRMRRPRFYDYAWSLSVPPVVRRIMEGAEKLPRVGKRGTIASLLNSWLKRNRTGDTVKLTSCVPRARMDHVLRMLVSSGHMAEKEYEWVMDHTIETSNQSYLMKN
jgi:hypothetical protein